MPLAKDERDRILSMLEQGQINAREAAQLLDMLGEDGIARPPEAQRERILRIRATAFRTGSQKTHFSASMPLSLFKMGMRLGSHLLPQLNNQQVTEMLQAVESSNAGRVLDLQDLEQGERLEIFIE